MLKRSPRPVNLALGQLSRKEFTIPFFVCGLARFLVNDLLRVEIPKPGEEFALEKKVTPVWGRNDESALKRGVGERSKVVKN